MADITTILGGSLGETAAKIIGMFKLSPEKKAEFEAAVKEHEFELQKMQQDMQEKLLDHEKDLEAIAAADRDSARKREMAVRGLTASALAWLIIGSFTAVVIAVLRGWGKVEAAFAGTLVGYLAANANQVVSYYFGSSAGSDRKTELMSQKGESQ